MARPRINRVILLLGVILQLITNAGPSFALCIAEDGDTALELAHADEYCVTDYRRHHAEADAVSDYGQQRCTDIVMSHIPLPSSDFSHLDAALPSANLCHSEISSHTGALPGWRADKRVERDPRLPALRTVVLTV